MKPEVAVFQTGCRRAEWTMGTEAPKHVSREDSPPPHRHSTSHQLRSSGIGIQLPADRAAAKSSNYDDSPDFFVVVSLYRCWKSLTAIFASNLDAAIAGKLVITLNAE